VTLKSPEARAYLERLRDLLPAREAGRVVTEVESLIFDRVEAEGAGVLQEEAERRALAHLGSPDVLVDTLAEAPLQVGWSSRRAFTRWFSVLAAGHLLFSILLTVGQAEHAAVPGLLGPLPLAPWWGTVSAALGIVLLDAGLMFVLFTLLGAWGRRGGLPLPGRARGWTRVEALRTLVLLALLALIAHPLRDEIFAVRRGATATPFLAPDLVALLPWLDVVLGLVALRALLVLSGKADAPLTHAIDMLAGLGGVLVLVLAATRHEIVRLPAAVLGQEVAGVLASIITRVLMLVFVAAALLLAVAVIKRLARLRQVLAA